ncbi:hypothetical protein WP12_03415 [Sphingomonas sp. SRS2]|nr:hypothetical protein WP12_03415 [Sphingomonas sp. SRS2]
MTRPTIVKNPAIAILIIGAPLSGDITRRWRAQRQRRSRRASLRSRRSDPRRRASALSGCQASSRGPPAALAAFPRVVSRPPRRPMRRRSACQRPCRRQPSPRPPCRAHPLSLRVRAGRRSGLFDPSDIRPSRRQ